MKILIIDNLFHSNNFGKIANGAQKFARNQMNLLSDIAETFYITAQGSDRQYQNQFILDSVFDLELSRKNKVVQTKKIAKDISEIIHLVNPDVVLDNSCKHMSGIWINYPTGIVFEHYHRPSMPLGTGITSVFDKKKVYWCGVSKFQAKKFNNYFHDTICIHYVGDEIPSEIKPFKDYGIFIGRWDKGKAPHVFLKNYLKSNPKYLVKCFLNFGGVKIDDKELNYLQQYPIFEFHFDASREEILSTLSEAKFGLGMGNESTGIVSLEYATHGVPYIVPGRTFVAENEHLPEEAIYLCDRALSVGIPEQISQAVQKCEEWTHQQRKDLSSKIITTFNKQHFIDEHIRIIENARGKINGQN